MTIQVTFLIEIRTKFYQCCLGIYGFFDIHQFLRWMNVLQKYVMNRLVDDITEGIRVVGGGDIFES